MTDERYHYVECGLDDVYLISGYEYSCSARGKNVAISDIDGLHRVIGEQILLRNRDLTGREIRFLRQEMLLSQVSLAQLLGVGEQTIHRWEAGKTKAPKTAEALVRLLYKEIIGPHGQKIRDVLVKISNVEDGIDRRSELVFTRCVDAKTSRWSLAA